MTRSSFVLNTESNRRSAIDLCRNMPPETRVTFKAERRSLEQNAKLHAMMADISRQVDWHGVKLSMDDWKILMLNALDGELRVVPNIDGNGFVTLGRRTSDLSIAECADLIELAYKFGAEHGVKWSDPTRPPPHAEAA